MKSKNHKKFDQILGLFKKHYVTLFIFSAVINFLMLAPSWYMLQVYDRVLTSFDENTLYGLSIIVLFLYIIYGLLEKFRGFILVGISEGIDAKTSYLVHDSIINPGVKDKQKGLSGLSDLNTVKQFLTGQPILSFLDAPWVVIYIFVIYLLHPMLGLVALLSVLILLLVAFINQSRTSPGLSEAQKQSVSERRFASNILNGADSIQVMGMGPILKARMQDLRSIYLENLFSSSIRGSNWSAVSKFFRTLIQSLILGYGGYLAINNEITAGMMIAGSILLGRALAPIEGVINSWKQLGEFKKAYANLNDILADVKDEKDSVDLGRPAGAVELKDVVLSLRDQGPPTLRNVSVSLDAGEVLAIVGPSGAGKTSLLKVMCGLYTPQSGQALLDGAELANRDLNTLGHHMGYLSQTIEILAGKVSLNISRFNEIDNEELLRAAKLSGAHEAILNLPEAYETELGDGGFGLSEGQKRKIGLARAFYGKPAIVFLDEPGSGLDDASLLNVMRAIQQLQASGTTVVFSTHQAALVQIATKVLVLVNGEVKLFGDKKYVLESLSSKESSS
jgi:ATP-binding cassette subfamily C exporter for protease/lipase